MTEDEVWQIVNGKLHALGFEVDASSGRARGETYSSFTQPASVFRRVIGTRLDALSDLRRSSSGAGALLEALKELVDREVVIHVLEAPRWLAYAIELPLEHKPVGVMLLPMAGGKVVP